MGTFERLSVLVIGVILVMILVVAVVTWTDDPVPCRIDQAGTDEPGPDEDLPPSPRPIVVVPDPFPEPDPEVDPPLPAPQPEPAPKPRPEAKLAGGPVRPSPRIHVVQRGETLTSIARTYYGPVKRYREIMRANDLETPLIRPGQKLTIPAEETFGLDNEPDKLQHQPAQVPQIAPTPGQPYTVRSGEDLPGIAKRAYNDMERWVEIWIANRKTVPDPKVKLREGTILQIP